MKINKIIVTPAKAGVQGQKRRQCVKPWIPAFAGMTAMEGIRNAH